MPIYAYRCTDCGHEFDVLQKVSDAPLTECPACQRPALTKKVTAAGFQLKGSGWYVTDFRDKSAARKAADNGDSAKTSDAAAKSAEPAAPAGSDTKGSDTKASNTKASNTKASDAPAAPAKPAAPTPPTPTSTD
jgi:putative FmdB family regulatory protein